MIPMTSFFKYKFCFLIVITAFCSCGNNPHGNITETDKLPDIDPDYSGISIPFNIAPLNFRINQEASAYYVRFAVENKAVVETESKTGIIKVPMKKWKKMLNENKGNNFDIEIYSKDNKGTWTKYKTLTNHIAAEPVDEYLTYRLLFPGYESWKEISIKRRNIESFRERTIIKNSVVDQNCINCHSYNNGKSDDFLFHMRGTHGGTYFYKDGALKKINLKTEEMKNGAVYPRWHPSGKFVAFSSNRIVQQFHAAMNKKVEVSDLESSIVIYDVEDNEISEINLDEKNSHMDTYPEWSPDGKYLYFCRADTAGKMFDYQQIHYDLIRVPFDPSSGEPGEAELIFNASALHKSVSFPRISPDGKFVVVTLHDYGCFPIWHREADLWSIDLGTQEAAPLDLNSDMTDSYHSWSSNGRWLVFSSKRIDGLTARPFISFIDENGKAGKPFILPQNDPEFYNRFLKSYNLPEFSELKIDFDPGKIRRAAILPPAQAKWAEN